MPVAERELLTTAAELFKALAAPRRLAILQQLESGPACVHELAADLGASQPLVSQHLRVLRAADLVRGIRRGKEIAYEIADHHVAQLVADAVAHVTESDHTTARPPASPSSEEHLP